MQKRQAGRQRSCVDLLHQGAGSTEGGLCGHSGGVTGGVSGTCVCQQIPERDWQSDLEPVLNRKEMQNRKKSGFRNQILEKEQLKMINQVWI